MPIPCPPDARLISCSHCHQVFLHLPDTANPVPMHESVCPSNLASRPNPPFDYSSGTINITASPVLTSWNAGPVVPLGLST